MDSRNVKIPLPLLNQMINLLEQVNLLAFKQSVLPDYVHVLTALRAKKHSIDLRGFYSEIILADNEDTRNDAKMRYLLEKRRFTDGF